MLIATHSGHLYSVDGLMYYRSADRIVTAGSLLLDPPVTWDPGPGVRATVAPIGLSLALTPAIVLATPFRDQQPPLTPTPYDPDLLYADGLYAAASWVNPALGALVGALVVLIARMMAVRRTLAVAAGMATVVSGPLIWYARADYPQVLTTALLLGAVLVIMRTHDGRSWILGPVLAGIVFLALLTRPVDGALTALVAAGGLTAVWRGSGRTPAAVVARAWPVVLGIVAGAVGLALVNIIRRGDPADFGYGESFGGFLPAGILAYLVSPGRSFIAHLPLALVAAVGAITIWRARDHVGIALLLLPFAAWLLVYGQWIGLSGWAYGPRFLIPLVPLAVILAAVAVQRGAGPWLSRSFAIAAVGGALLAASAVAVDQLRFIAIIGANRWGTPGFWLEFHPDAYAPIASWWQAQPIPDIWWFRQIETTGGWSLLVPAILGPLAVALAIRAWRVAQAS